jgi:hypothetical protein
MATFYGVGATLRDNTIPARPINPPDGYARRMVMYDEYTLLADLAVNDIINFMKIPKGARVLGGALKYGAGGGSAAVGLGWAASSDAVEAASATGFLSAQSVVSAGAVSLLGSAAGFLKSFAAEVQVQLKCSAVTSGATGIKFQLALDIAVV